MKVQPVAKDLNKETRHSGGGFLFVTGVIYPYDMFDDFLAPSPEVLERLAHRLNLKTEDIWDEIGDEWACVEHSEGEIFLRLRKGDYDVALQPVLGSEIRISPVEGRWSGPFGLELGLANNYQVLNPGDDYVQSLIEAIDKAALARRSTFRVCKYCKEYVAPEHMDSKNVCQNCATQYEGVVY